jgi:hypothetical protein
METLLEGGSFFEGPRWRDGRWWYYLDDGLYGSYSGQLFDHAKYPVSALRSEGELFESVLAGPTCDSIDIIDDRVLLPELNAGDLVVGRMMGAYTWASATDFNFFERATVIVMDHQLTTIRSVGNLGSEEFEAFSETSTPTLRKERSVQPPAIYISTGRDRGWHDPDEVADVQKQASRT